MKKKQMSPSEEILVVTTNTSQICRLSLVSSDLMKSEDSLFEPLLTGFHHGTIHGMDVCLRKPLVVTCGADKTVKYY